MVRAIHAVDDRVALRISLAERPGLGGLDGGWWPQSRDLEVELRDLIDHFPGAAGRIVGVICSQPDWEDSDDPASHIATRDRRVEVSRFPGGADTHLLIIRTAGHGRLHMLVVPPTATLTLGKRALRLAAHSSSRLSPALVMRTLGPAALRPVAVAAALTS